MTTIRRITVSQIDGNDANSTDTNEIRPFGETAFYLDQSQNPSKLTLMMFNGTRTHLKSKVLSPGVLFGSNADGGAGGPILDTIKLIPDAELYANQSNDYHVVVDVTGEGQISLRAGGAVNSSSVDIVLGGTENHVSVSDSSDRVEIQTSNGVTSRVWRFDNSGHITFPDNTIQTTAFTGAVTEADTLATVASRGSTTGNTITVGGVVSPTVGAGVSEQVGTQVTGIRPPEGAGGNNGYVWVPDETQISSLGDITGWTLTNSDGIFSTTVVQMRNDLGASWAIETADPLIFTGTYTFTSPNYAPPAQRNLTLTSNGYNLVLLNTGKVSVPAAIISQTGQLELAGSQSSYDLGRYLRVRDGDFASHLHLDTADNNTYDIILGDDNKFVRVDHTGPVVIGTSGAISYNWSFGTDGSLTLPIGGDIKDSNGFSVLGGSANEILNTDGVNTWSVSVSTTGVVSMNTGRGGLEFGAMPEIGAPSHLHIMRPAGQESSTDLFFGDDYNYIRLPGLYGPNTQGVEIGSSYNSGTVSVWRFGTDGSLTFPDSTVQSIAYTGGRIVSAPAASTGAAGDLAGDLAFADDYIYRCFADFGSAPTETFTVVNVGDFTNTISVNIAANPNYTVPQAGWYVVIGGVTMTLTAFSGISGSNYNFIFDNPSGAALPSTVTLTSNTGYTNIWKRIAWSGDTW